MKKLLFIFGVMISMIACKQGNVATVVEDVDSVEVDTVVVDTVEVDSASAIVD